MDSPRLIFFLLIYVVFVSTAVALFAGGMNLAVAENSTNINASGINFATPTEPGLLNSNFASSLATVVLSVLFWNVSEAVFPLWANVILVKIPLVCLVAAIVEVLLP